MEREKKEGGKEKEDRKTQLQKELIVPKTELDLPN